MKKIMFIFGIIMIAVLNCSFDKDLIIPNEAIRIRVVANSNSVYDQEIKQIIKGSIQEETIELLKDVNNIKEARNIIQSNIPKIDLNVKKILQKNNYSIDYSINYGLNFFPHKEYKGITYEEGYYESLVITLGKGKGNNWWCVLFPPLCLVETNNEDMEKVEYKSYISEIINKYFFIK